MYESYYRLSGAPFSLLPDADFLFMSKRHRRAVNMLDYGMMTQAGFMVLTGEVGAGKTTIIRHQLKTIGDTAAVGVITNTHRSLGKLSSWVAAAFELEHRDKDDITLYNGFIDFLMAQYGAGKRTVLIIDEAQNFGADMLEELRMLSNVNGDKDQLLQIMLVGQPELLETLRQPSLRQFVQRVAVHCHLDPLDRGETADYIRHRLAKVGGAPNLFDDQSCNAVFDYTGGVPRLINMLCDTALVYGFSDELPVISIDCVDEAASDRSRSGLSPFNPKPAPLASCLGPDGFGV